ncbi:MAG: leucine-rich repeat domain-containing protein [Corallococcus sp.]|nr:leucine-rich repeat domain-containing protein [Corallococcus sp.]MCM1359638.1 leucine-rich repeat domain-containing protein [Corallococcus sp.]MCM1395230.1 leucine-rich repeat domain-containing protein [Corallococcus sp.]
MNKKIATLLCVLLCVLCLCAALVACDPSNPGGGGGGGQCNHQWYYEPSSENEHFKKCTKCNVSSYETHAMDGDNCLLCGYYHHVCTHPEFYYNPTQDVEKHIAQCAYCEYNYLEKHVFNGGDVCEKCYAEKRDVVRKIGNLYYTLHDDATASVSAWEENVSHGESVSGAVTVPSSVSYDGLTYTVTKVVDYGFSESGVTSIVLPQTVTELGMGSFSNCKSLTSVQLPQGLLHIGEWAFSNSQKVNSVLVPSSVVTIGQDAFNFSSEKSISTVYCQVPSKPDGYADGWINMYAQPDFPTNTRVVWNVRETGSAGEYDYALLNDDTVTLVQYNGNADTLEIPAKLDGRPVTAIADQACYAIEALQTIVLPDGIVSIGNWAFYGNSGIASINVPSSVTFLGTRPWLDGVVYYDCSKDNVPEGFDGGNAERYTDVFNSGTQAVLVDGLRYALDASDNTAAVSVNPKTVQGHVVLPKTIEYDGTTYTVTAVRDNAFLQSNIGSEIKITSVYVPDTVVEIGNAIYDSNAWSKGVRWYYEGSVGIYGDSYNVTTNAVYDQASRLWYSVDNGVATVARQYSELDGNIVIPQTVTVNGVVNNITGVESYAFAGCNNVKSVKIAASIDTLKASAFANNSGIESVTFENGSVLETLGYRAFYNCTSLKTVEIPSSVISIEAGAFDGCASLKGVYIYDLAAWCGINFAESVSNPLRYSHNLYCNGALVSSLQVPSSVTEIKPLAFYGWNGTSVSMHDQVTKIGASAFAGSSNLQRVQLPSGIEQLGSRAFEYCVGLSEIKIPSSVTKVGSGVFNGCVALIVYCETETCPTVGWNADWWNVADDRAVWDCANNSATVSGVIFAEADGLRYEIKFYEDIREYRASVMPQHRYLTGEVTIPTGITLNLHGEDAFYPIISVQDYAFADCSKVTGVTIEQGIISIGKQAFRDCTGLAYVTFEDSSLDLVITEIGERAFENCSELAEIVIPKSVTDIGKYAFSGCVSLLTVEVEDPVSHDPETVKPGDEEILPSQLQTIGEYAFSGCNSLIKMNIPASVTSVGAFAFKEATALTLYCVSAENDDAVQGWNGLWQNIGITGRRFAVVWDCRKNNVAHTGYEYVYVDGVRYALKDGKAIVAEQPYVSEYVTILPEIVVDRVKYPVTGIANYAFNGCAVLREISIPASLTSIGLSAFDGCTGLERVNIADLAAWCKITLGYYKSNPLYYAHSLYLNGTKLTEIVIPAEVTTMGSMFCGWDGTKIVIHSKLVQISEHCFEDCPNLTIYCGAASADVVRYSKGWNGTCEVVWGYDC